MGEILRGRLQVARHFPQIFCRRHRQNKVMFLIGDDRVGTKIRELVCLACLRIEVERDVVDLTGELKVERLSAPEKQSTQGKDK